jgi:hypothetical protein
VRFGAWVHLRDAQVVDDLDLSSDSRCSLMPPVLPSRSYTNTMYFEFQVRSAKAKKKKGNKPHVPHAYKLTITPNERRASNSQTSDLVYVHGPQWGGVTSEKASSFGIPPPSPSPAWFLCHHFPLDATVGPHLNSGLSCLPALVLDDNGGTNAFPDESGKFSEHSCGL